MSTTQVVVQHPLRLLRVGVAEALLADPRITVRGLAATPHDMVTQCGRTSPDVAILDLGEAGWEACQLAFRLQRAQPTLRFVGLSAERDSLAVQVVRPCGIRHLAWVGDGTRALAHTVLQAARGSASSVRPPAGRFQSRSELTTREVHVLALIGAGCTSREISERLRITYKTVENHKQRIFAKLAVQNQAQAVALALRRGDIVGDQVLRLTKRAS